MRIVFLLFVAVASCPVWASDSVEHRFQDGDTLWFVSQIYYGEGFHYKKIMRANQLRSPDGVSEGQVLKIPEPLFRPDQPGFDLRLSYLHDKRNEALAKRAIATEASPFQKAKAEFREK